MKHLLVGVFLLLNLSLIGQTIDLVGKWSGVRINRGSATLNRLDWDIRADGNMDNIFRASQVSMEVNWELQDSFLLLRRSRDNQPFKGKILDYRKDFIIVAFTQGNNTYHYLMHRYNTSILQSSSNFYTHFKTANTLDTNDVVLKNDSLSFILLNDTSFVYNSGCFQFHPSFTKIQLGKYQFLFKERFLFEMTKADEHTLELIELFGHRKFRFSNQITDKDNSYERLLGSWKLDRVSRQSGTIYIGFVGEKITFTDDGEGTYEYDDVIYPIKWLLENNEKVHVIIYPSEVTGGSPANNEDIEQLNNLNIPSNLTYLLLHTFHIRQLDQDSFDFLEINCQGIDNIYGQRVE